MLSFFSKNSKQEYSKELFLNLRNVYLIPEKKFFQEMTIIWSSNIPWAWKKKGNSIMTILIKIGNISEGSKM